MENHKKYILAKTNLYLIAIAFFLVCLGFFLMIGPPSEVDFNPDIFSTKRIVVGPMISLFGFLAIIFAILYKPKKRD